MPVTASQLGLGIDSPLVAPTAPNFRPPHWPPPKDFPIVIDAKDNVISRYGDPEWKLWPWAKKSITLNFGDGPRRKGRHVVSTRNADLFRQVCAWWLYGRRAAQTPRSLEQRFKTLKPLFILCSQRGICASELSRFPAVSDEYFSSIRPSSGEAVLSHLHTLYEERELLGFTLLDREGLSRLEAALPEHVSRQTPYIPPRIWLYQVKRLRDFLDDFNEHSESIESCFRFCLEAYAKNASSLENSYSGKINSSRKPFIKTTATGAKSGAEFYGHFSKTARRFKVDGVLQKWILQPEKSIEDRNSTISLLSSYLSMASYVGLAYLLNFSMMRVEEGWSLRSNCLIVERDPNLGPIYLLAGPTTKTVQDDDARWVTSPSVTSAIEALQRISRLRIEAAAASTSVPTTPEDIENPHLFLRSYEPWAGAKAIDKPLSIRPHFMSYSTVATTYPKLFDQNELTVTDEDLNVARLVTPSLNSKTFSVGKPWPLAWHQLRRTGAVNMQASGLVSDASVQYQLKQATRAMALYYGQGRSVVRLNKKAKGEYIRTMYEVLGKQISGLFAERFVSPYGEQRKTGILRIVKPEDSKKLAIAARTGAVSWRETLLGGCTKIGACEYGGIDNVARCGGGDGSAPCIDALYDREKAPQLLQLQRVIAIRLDEAPMGSPYRQSLEAQQRAVENVLDALAN